MRIINKTKGTTLTENGIIADSFFLRLRGLIGVKELRDGEGLVIKPCSSIHTFFMTFNIDVVFLDSNGVVQKIVEGLRPFRMCACLKRSTTVVELPEKKIQTSCTEPSDIIVFQPGKGIF